jgi:hypothetical protein
VQAQLEAQDEVRGVFGEQLLGRQVKLDQAREMAEMVDSFEKRIHELRTMLVNKELEISLSDLELGRESLPRKENIQLLSSLSAHNHAIVRHLREHKKLTTEVEALRYVLAAPPKPLPAKPSQHIFGGNRSKDLLV